MIHNQNSHFNFKILVEVIINIKLCSQTNNLQFKLASLAFNKPSIFNNLN